jgi:hypothetical protein
MSFNGSDPASVATDGEARKMDLLGSTITFENAANANANQGQRWKAVRAHIAKGDQLKNKAEQHYIAAGRHLAALKAEHTGTWANWEAVVKEKAGIGKSRASELMQIADGRKTVADIRERAADSMRQSRAQIPPQRCGENADNSEDEAMKAQRAEAAQRIRKLQADIKACQDELAKELSPLANGEISAESLGAKLTELVAAGGEIGIPERLIEAHWLTAVEPERLASKLIKLDRGTAHALQQLLSDRDIDYIDRLEQALARGLDDGIPECLRRASKALAS